MVGVGGLLIAAIALYFQLKNYCKQQQILLNQLVTIIRFIIL